MPETLQDGLFRLCARALQKEGSMTSMVDKKTFEAFRERRFIETVRHAYAKSRFYRTAFDRCGLTPRDIRGLNDLSKIPFTMAQDLAGANYEFLCISQGNVEKPVTYFSSGTTGLQKRLYFSQADIREIQNFLAVGMRTVADPGETIQILLPNSSGRGIGTILGAALQQNSMHAVVTDVFESSARQIEYTRRHKPSVWFGDAGVIYRITKEMEHATDLSRLGVRVLFLTMGYVADSMRTNLETIWGCRVLTHYGLTETGWGLAVECPAIRGYHYNEFGVIAEVIDPETGEPLPEGTEGELVFTTIGREAMPLLRYRSRDIAWLRRAPCACGCTLDAIGTVAKRQEAVVLLPNGTEIYPAMFSDTLYSFENVVDYDICLHKKTDGPALIFQVETTDNTNSAMLRDALEALPCIQQGKAKIQVETLPLGALKATCLRKKLIREAV